MSDPFDSRPLVERYTPPHLRVARKAMASAGSLPAPARSMQGLNPPPSSPPQPPSSGRSPPKLSARGNPLWSDQLDEAGLPPPLKDPEGPTNLKTDVSAKADPLANTVTPTQSKQLTAHDKGKARASSSSGAPCPPPHPYTSSSTTLPEPVSPEHATRPYQRPETPPPPNPATTALLEELQRFRLDSRPPTSVDEDKLTQEELERRWTVEPHVTVELDDEETTQYIQELLDTGVIFYFHDRPPSLDGFTHWAVEEFEYKRTWHITQIRYLGRNFFIVLLITRTQQEELLAEAPWFLGKRYTYTFPWTTSFNVQTAYITHAPVWIELPLRDQIYESQRHRLVQQLGTVLHYCQGEQSRYPNDRVCILWDIRRPTPKRLRIIFRSLTLWQPVEFKTLPTICSICRSSLHLAYACPRCPVQVAPLPAAPTAAPTPPPHRPLSRQIQFPAPQPPIPTPCSSPRPTPPSSSAPPLSTPSLTVPLPSQPTKPPTAQAPPSPSPLAGNNTSQPSPIHITPCSSPQLPQMQIDSPSSPDTPTRPVPDSQHPLTSVFPSTTARQPSVPTLSHTPSFLTPPTAFSPHTYPLSTPLFPNTKPPLQPPSAPSHAILHPQQILPSTPQLSTLPATQTTLPARSVPLSPNPVLHSSQPTAPHPSLHPPHQDSTLVSTSHNLPEIIHPLSSTKSAPSSLPTPADHHSPPAALPSTISLTAQDYRLRKHSSFKIRRSPRSHPYTRLRKQQRTSKSSPQKKNTKALQTYKRLLRAQHDHTTALPNPYPTSSTSDYTSMDEADAQTVTSTIPSLDLDRDNCNAQL
jgi:hypothetical protein